MKTFLKWIAFVSIAAGLFWMVSDHLAGDTRPRQKAEQSEGQSANVEFDPASKSQEPIIAPRYGLFKDLKPGEEPQKGPKVHYHGSLDRRTGHIVLTIRDYVDSTQTFSWLPTYNQPESGLPLPGATGLDETGWAGGEWSTILDNEDEGDTSGKIQIKELPGGEFRIKRYEPDARDSTKDHLKYTGTLKPLWSAG